MARSLFLLTILLNFAFCLEEFIFWAKVDTKNQIVAFEEISFSMAMTLTPNPKPKFLCQIDAFKDENTTTLGFLNLHKDEIFDCFALKKAVSYTHLDVYKRQTYGNAKSPQTVGECEAPNNVYGFSKLSMDNINKIYAKRGVSVVGLRYFNVFGKGEFFKNKTASMVPVSYTHLDVYKRQLYAFA